MIKFFYCCVRLEEVPHFEAQHFFILFFTTNFGVYCLGFLHVLSKIELHLNLGYALNDNSCFMQKNEKGCWA